MIDKVAAVLVVSVVGRAAHLSNETLLLLLFSVANVFYLAVAVSYDFSERPLDPGKRSSKKATYGILAVALALCSQLLCMGFGFAWWFHWMKFYPGNPVQVLQSVPV